MVQVAILKSIQYVRVVVWIAVDVIKELTAIDFAHDTIASHRIKVGRDTVGSEVVAVRPIHVCVDAVDRDGFQNVLCTWSRWPGAGNTKRHVGSIESTVDT